MKPEYAGWFVLSRKLADRSIGDTTPSPDNAGVVAPAPVLYATCVAVGAAVEYVVPSSLLPSPLGGWVAVGLIAGAIGIVVPAFNALARAQTAFDARKSTTRIVTAGPFSFSRNPTYLALSMLHIGVSFALGSLWVLLTLVPAVAVTQWGVIRREERYLETKFGDEYRRYASMVRRWI